VTLPCAFVALSSKGHSNDSQSHIIAFPGQFNALARTPLRPLHRLVSLPDSPATHMPRQSICKPAKRTTALPSTRAHSIESCRGALTGHPSSSPISPRGKTGSSHTQAHLVHCDYLRSGEQSSATPAPGPPNKALKPTALCVTILARRKNRATPAGPHSPTGQGGGLALALGGPRFSRQNGWRLDHETEQSITSQARFEPTNQDHTGYPSPDKATGSSSH
jgi:hypothetical protein